MGEIETRSSSFLEELAHEVSNDSIFLQYVDLQNTLTKRVYQTRASLDSLSLVALDAEIDSWQYDSLPEVSDVVFMQICGCTQAEFDTLSTRLERISIALSDRYRNIFPISLKTISLYLYLYGLKTAKTCSSSRALTTMNSRLKSWSFAKGTTVAVSCRFVPHSSIVLTKLATAMIIIGMLPWEPLSLSLEALFLLEL
jgi:hypothetical protein